MKKPTTPQQSPHTPQEVDYSAIINQFDILNYVARNEIDEEWVFGFPHAGFYESAYTTSGGLSISRM